jgi:hypothetical protein
MGLAQGLAFWPPPARKPALDTLPARELAHHPPTAWGVTPIPRRLGGSPPDLHHAGGWLPTPTSREGNLHGRAAAAADDQRLKASCGSARIRSLWHAR